MTDTLTANFAGFFTATSLAGFFIKAFSIVFALLYLIYTVVTYKQTQEIARTVNNPRNRFILFISLLQIFGALILLAFAITLV